MTVLTVVLLATMALALAVIVTVARSSRDRDARRGRQPVRAPDRHTAADVAPRR